jgi:hypothetical protein
MDRSERGSSSRREAKTAWRGAVVVDRGGGNVAEVVERGGGDEHRWGKSGAG